MAQITNIVIDYVDDSDVDIVFPTGANEGDYVLYSDIVAAIETYGGGWSDMAARYLSGFGSVAEARSSLCFEESFSGSYYDPQTDRFVILGASIESSFIIYTYIARPISLVFGSSQAACTVLMDVGRDTNQVAHQSAYGVISLSKVAEALGEGPLSAVLSANYANANAMSQAFATAGLVIPSSYGTRSEGLYLYFMKHSGGGSEIFLMPQYESFYTADDKPDLFPEQAAVTLLIPTLSGGGATTTSSGLQVTVTNLTDKAVFLSDIYASIPAEGSVSFVRSPSDLPSMYALNKLIAAGVLSATWEAIVP